MQTGGAERHVEKLHRRSPALCSWAMGLAAHAGGLISSVGCRQAPWLASSRSASFRFQLEVQQPLDREGPGREHVAEPVDVNATQQLRVEDSGTGRRGRSEHALMGSAAPLAQPESPSRYGVRVQADGQFPPLAAQGHGK